ncbi:MAG: radical SAM protein [Nitrosarchaeum sp.]
MWIHDDSFFLNNDRVIEFCDEIISQNISTKFICSGRFKPISEKMVKKLEQANFIQVLLGLESGDETILKTRHKNITPDDVIKAVKLFAETKIEIYAFLIIGLPGENLQ